MKQLICTPLSATRGLPPVTSGHAMDIALKKNKRASQLFATKFVVTGFV